MILHVCTKAHIEQSALYLEYELACGDPGEMGGKNIRLATAEKPNRAFYWGF